jgi:hypothetical protein
MNVWVKTLTPIDYNANWYEDCYAASESYFGWKRINPSIDWREQGIGVVLENLWFTVQYTCKLKCTMCGERHFSPIDIWKGPRYHLICMYYGIWHNLTSIPRWIVCYIKYGREW